MTKQLIPTEFHLGLERKKILTLVHKHSVTIHLYNFMNIYEALLPAFHTKLTYIHTHIHAHCILSKRL